MNQPRLVLGHKPWTKTTWLGLSHGVNQPSLVLGLKPWAKEPWLGLSPGVQ